MIHKDLAAGRWFTFPLVEQLANIGSEVERAMRWHEKGNGVMAEKANYRALELFDLTIQDKRHRLRLKELCRARELWLDFFIGENQYRQTAKQWHNYFHTFTYASQARKGL